ncbi:MAG TPA: hypothetical protein PKE29_14350 [Phycisphaerales bacterium]|nr:hypothetical protein [Phycisphaerales bacterium]
MNLPSTPTLRIDAPFTLIALAATLAAGALAAAPYLLDRGPTPVEQQELVVERRAIVADSEKDLAKYRALVESLEARQTNAFRLRPPSALNDRIVELNALARECSAAVSQIAPQPPGAPQTVAGGGKVVIVPIKLSGAATYQNATRFLRLLRARFPDTAVTDMRIAAAPADAAPTAAYALDLAWYADPASPVVSAAPATRTP